MLGSGVCSALVLVHNLALVFAHLIYPQKGLVRSEKVSVRYDVKSVRKKLYGCVLVKCKHECVCVRVCARVCVCVCACV